MKKDEENSENLISFAIKYTRQERSKDSNGSSKEYILKNEKLSFEEKNWGFKARKNLPIKSVEISQEDSIEIFNFLEKKSLFCNYNKVITIKKERSFSTFTYEATIVTSVKTYKLFVQSNDLPPNYQIVKKPDYISPNGKVFDSFKDLFFYLTRKFIEKS